MYDKGDRACSVRIYFIENHHRLLLYLVQVHWSRHQRLVTLPESRAFQTEQCTKPSLFCFEEYPGSQCAELTKRKMSGNNVR